MKRVQVIFQPGMRALIRQRFPGEDLLTATRELISSQLQQLRNWNNHHIVRNWMHLPPRSAQENGSSDPNVTPGIEPGSSIEDVIRDCAIISMTSHRRSSALPPPMRTPGATRTRSAAS